MFKVNNKDTRTTSKSIPPENCKPEVIRGIDIDVVLLPLLYFWTDFIHCSAVSIFDFEQVYADWVVQDRKLLLFIYLINSACSRRWIRIFGTAWKVFKYGPEKTPYLDTFHAVWVSPMDAFLVSWLFALRKSLPVVNNFWNWCWIGSARSVWKLGLDAKFSKFAFKHWLYLEFFPSYTPLWLVSAFEG